MRRWLVVALALAACSKDEPKPTPAPAPTPISPPTPAPTPEKVQQPAPPLKQGPGSADLTLLPVDSELVLGVDFAALSASAVWKQMIEPQVMSASIKGKLADYKQKCGYDPMTVKRLMPRGRPRAWPGRRHRSNRVPARPAPRRAPAKRAGLDGLSRAASPPPLGDRAAGAGHHVQRRALSRRLRDCACGRPQPAVALDPGHTRRALPHARVDLRPATGQRRQDVTHPISRGLLARR